MRFAVIFRFGLGGVVRGGDVSSRILEKFFFSVTVFIFLVISVGFFGSFRRFQVFGYIQYLRFLFLLSNLGGRGCCVQEVFRVSFGYLRVALEFFRLVNFLGVFVFFKFWYSVRVGLGQEVLIICLRDEGKVVREVLMLLSYGRFMSSSSQDLCRMRESFGFVYLFVLQFSFAVIIQVLMFQNVVVQVRDLVFFFSRGCKQQREGFIQVILIIYLFMY